MQSNRETQQEQLITAIEKKFPLQDYAEFDQFYPVSNEFGFSQVIKILLQYRAHKSKKITVSLVFGESNFISLLPALSNLSDILLLADVNPKFHEHRNFLLDCFKTSQTPGEFENKYCSPKNPGIGCNIQGSGVFGIPELSSIFNFARNSVGKYHFFYNQETFDNCKKALDKMKLLPIHFNVSNRESCIELNNLLADHNADLNFCNVTNIEDYDKNLKDNIKLLLKGHENAFILCSTHRDKAGLGIGFPRTIINLGLNNYLMTDTSKAYTQFDDYVKHMLEVNDSLSSSVVRHHFVLRKSQIKKSAWPYKKSYVVVQSCDKDQMQEIINGNLDIRSFPLSYVRGNTPEEDDWVVSFYKNQENLGRFFQYANEAEAHKAKSAVDKDDIRISKHFKIYSRMISATKRDGSVTLEKSITRIPDKYQHNKMQLIAAIKDRFPLQNDSDFYGFYPFSNEYGYSQIIKILLGYRAHKSKKITVSLVFGESNFISLLPALSNLSDILLLADVNPRLHEHNRFLLDCFNTSKTPTEFIEKYRLKNPAIGQRIPGGGGYDWPTFRSCLLFAKDDSVGKHHFYKSQESFDRCKKALSKMKLLPIYFNVSNAQSCKDLNALLHKHNAELNFCNVTNIEEYDENLKDKVKLLLKGHENAFILCSSRNRKKEGDGLPRAIISLGLKDYLATDTNKAYTEFNEYIPHMLHVNSSLNHSVINEHFVIRNSQIKKDDKIYNKSYIAVFSCSKDQMQAIIDGKLDINSFSSSSAYNTEEGVNNLIIDLKNKKTTEINGRKIDVNNYWLVSFFKDAKNVNRFLFYAQMSVDKHRISRHLKLSSRIISATKMDGSMTIEKNPDCIPRKYSASLANSKVSFFNGNQKQIELNDNDTSLNGPSLQKKKHS